MVFPKFSYTWLSVIFYNSIDVYASTLIYIYLLCVKKDDKIIRKNVFKINCKFHNGFITLIKIILFA